LDPKNLWDLAGKNYDAAQERYRRERYPQNVFRMRRVFEMLDIAISKSDKKDTLSFLDIGCGYGETLRYAEKKGMHVVGIDYSSNMVNLAKKLLSEENVDIEIFVADATDLKQFKNESFDIISSNQVFGYIERSKEPLYMSECNRLLRQGGSLITAEINGIFDIATFNKFTIQFFMDNLIPLSFDNKETITIKNHLSKLVTNPDKPAPPLSPNEQMSFSDAMLNSKETRFSSHRDQTFTKSENPLDYGQLMKKYGFALDDLAFYHFHSVPPLLFNVNPEWEKRAEALEDKYNHSWQGYFMASSFVAHSIKQKNLT